MALNMSGVITRTNAIDDGLQPQRTALSWSRTSLVMFVNMLLLVRLGADVLIYSAVLCLAIGCGLTLLRKRKAMLFNEYSSIGNKVMIAHAILAFSMSLTALNHSWYVCRDLLVYID